MVRNAGLIAGLATGLLFASILHLDGVRDLQLILFVGFSWAVAAWLMIRNRRIWKDAGSGWTFLLVWLTLGVALFGVHTELPIPENLNTDLGLLIVGAGWAAAGVGVEIGQDDENCQSSTAATAD